MTMTTTRKCDYNKYIDEYMRGVRSGEILVGKDIKKAMDHIESKLNDDDVFIDHDKIDKAVEIIEKYFKIKLFDWELFILALVHCYYKSNDTVVFSEFVILMGRGNGKNGFISCLGWYLTTHYHGIKQYNIDIIANSEDQAQTSFFDIYDVLEDWKTKIKKFFYWTKEKIVNRKTNSYIKFNTSNARTKDGKRSGCLIFDEIHEYENYDMIKVFTSGFGKKKHARTFYITTNGNVREGVLDDKINLAERILNGEAPKLRTCALLYRIDDKKQAKDKKCWHMPNPSLKYLPELMVQMEEEFIKMEFEAHIEVEFYTKRMNYPKSDRDKQVTDWDNIKATNKELPDLSGRSCTVGIDYTKLTDFASVNFHFKIGEQRYDINKTWICSSSKDIPRLQIPWKDWVDAGELTLVDDVEIGPDLIVDYIKEMSAKYHIEMIAMDSYRYALLARYLKDIGFDSKTYKNLKLVQPSDIMKVVPVIESCFVNQYFIWGDKPSLRWATNNTKLIPKGKRDGTDTGNYYYGKIEAKSRKTDSFMALVASMTVESKIIDYISNETPDMGVFSY